MGSLVGILIDNQDWSQLPSFLVNLELQCLSSRTGSYKKLCLLLQPLSNCFLGGLGILYWICTARNWQMSLGEISYRTLGSFLRGSGTRNLLPPNLRCLDCSHLVHFRVFNQPHFQNGFQSVGNSDTSAISQLLYLIYFNLTVAFFRVNGMLSQKVQTYYISKHTTYFIYV